MSPEERRRCSAAPPPLVPPPAGEEGPVASLEGAIAHVSRESSRVEIAISVTRSASTESTACETAAPLATAPPVAATLSPPPPAEEAARDAAPHCRRTPCVRGATRPSRPARAARAWGDIGEI